MFRDGIVALLPAIELNGAVEALDVIVRVGGGAVEEARAGELSRRLVHEDCVNTMYSDIQPPWKGSREATRLCFQLSSCWY